MAETLTQPGRMLTAEDAAEHYQVHRRKVWQWINSGKLKAINIAKGTGRPTWRIPPDSLPEFDRSRQNVEEQSYRRRRRAAATVDVVEFIK